MCAEARLPCPNVAEGCEATLTRLQMLKHLRLCDSYLVECFECRTSILRYDIHQHMTSVSTVYHFHLHPHHGCSDACTLQVHGERSNDSLKVKASPRPSGRIRSGALRQMVREQVTISISITISMSHWPHTSPSLRSMGTD